MSSIIATSVPVAATACFVAVLVAAACVAAARAAGVLEHDGARPARRGAATGPAASDGAIRGVVVAFVVLVATRWPVLALAVGGLVAMWPVVMRDDRADRERMRVEGIAKWLEDLRDTVRGSAIGAEEALDHVARRPPAAIAEPLATFALRRRQGMRATDALDGLADDLDHPLADSAIAAIRLVVGGAAGTGRIHPTVSALAEAARDEVRARERVDRTRAIYQHSMQRLVVILGVLVCYLRVASGELLEPYGTPVGQVVLMIPLAMWAGCIAWLRSLSSGTDDRRRVVAGRRASVESGVAA
jgi:hypothetical protein